MVKMRPRGVVSKNDMGAWSTFLSVFPCILADARYDIRLKAAPLLVEILDELQ